MERTKLSAVVKALRKEYGLTQENLAMKSGVRSFHTQSGTKKAIVKDG